MSIRPLVILPDSRLRLISDPVMRVDARSATQITFLVKTLLSYRYTSAPV